MEGQLHPYGTPGGGWIKGKTNGRRIGLYRLNESSTGVREAEKEICREAETGRKRGEEPQLDSEMAKNKENLFWCCKMSVNHGNRSKTIGTETQLDSEMAKYKRNSLFC